jgi:glyoxylase-like metal-dependent hydrolase (beta-lactamase superfamily II)
MDLEIRDVAPGLWLWRQPHPAWKEGADWEPEVSSFAVRSGGVSLLLDPLAPPPSAAAFWERIAAAPPDAVVVLKPDHVRDADVFVGRYGARAFGPEVFYPDNIPESPLEDYYAGDELPGGLLALFDGRARNERPLYLPDQRALVFADALTAPDGELLVWGLPWHETSVLPALRRLLELPFEHVIVSHGEPVHDRAAFERALERPPYVVDER